jgi:4-aminobutyrate aminotransferase-like enzyme
MTQTFNERMEQVLSPVLGHFTRLEVLRGRGSYLYTRDKRKVLDFANGIAVTNTGHCHPGRCCRCHQATQTMIHNCNGVSIAEPNIKYAEQLTSFLPRGLDQVWFCAIGYLKPLRQRSSVPSLLPGVKKFFPLPAAFTAEPMAP